MKTADDSGNGLSDGAGRVKVAFKSVAGFKEEEEEAAAVVVLSGIESMEASFQSNPSDPALSVSPAGISSALKESPVNVVSWLNGGNKFPFLL